MAAPPPSKNFLRVVAIGVQGLLNSQPRKTAEWLIRLNGGLHELPILCVHSYDHEEPPKKLLVETVYFEKVRIANLRATTRESVFGATFCGDVGLWAIDADPRITFLANEPSIAQKDMEQRVSRLYTLPYSVDAVKDKAIELAKQIAARSVRTGG